jgi:putative transposase
VADPAAVRAPDLVNRQFTATRPNQLWVSDFTYVASWSGTVDVAFIIDVFSRLIVGWRAAASMRTELVLDALEMAVWRRKEVLDGLVCHSDAGSQYTSIRSTDRLAEVGAAPSIGSVGDSYDNSLAESTIGLFKTELIRRPGPGAPWRTSNWPPASGQGLRCGPQAPSDLRLCSHHRIINGGRPGLLTEPHAPEQPDNDLRLEY